MKRHNLSTKKHQLDLASHGAHICSWKYQGQEQLFLSEQAIFDGETAIRGGVPLCFPQFGAFGPGKKHGFARNTEWQLLNKSETSIELSLQNTAASEEIWPYAFQAKFAVSVMEKGLEMTLSVVNHDTRDFEFTSALHTYFLIDDVQKCSLKGLFGTEFWDNGNEFSVRQKAKNEMLEINQAIDRVYFDVNETIELQEDSRARHISSEGFSDIVVWNPWLDGATSLKDMADNEFRKMICIESANVQNPIKLKPSESWSGAQTITIK